MRLFDGSSCFIAGVRLSRADWAGEQTLSLIYVSSRVCNVRTIHAFEYCVCAAGVRVAVGIGASASVCKCVRLGPVPVLCSVARCVGSGADWTGPEPDRT